MVGTHKFACMFPFKRVIAQSLVDDRNECSALDVSRKVEMPVRFVNMPLFLELCRRLSVVYRVSLVRPR